MSGAQTIIVPARGSPHEYDELIDALAVFMRAMIAQRFRDQSRTAPGIRSLADDLREVAGDADSEDPNRDAAPPAVKRKRHVSETTRAKMRQAQMRRFALARAKQRAGQ